MKLLYTLFVLPLLISFNFTCIKQDDPEHSVDYDYLQDPSYISPYTAEPWINSEISSKRHIEVSRRHVSIWMRLLDKGLTVTIFIGSCHFIFV